MRLNEINLTPPRAWTLVACLAFVFATAYAVAVVLFRLPFFLGDHGHRFRVALVLHVELAVFFWLMATMAAQWAAHTPGRAARALAFWALAGTTLLALSPLAGGTPLMADYFPWLDGNHWFALGFLLFIAAVTLMALRVVGRPAATPEWTDVQLAAWPTLMALLTLLSDLWNGAQGIGELAWGVGHALLFAHVSLMCRDWARLSGSDGRVERRSMLFFAIASLLFPLIPFLFAPGSAERHHAITATMSWLLWPPVLLVALSYLRRRRAGVPLAVLPAGAPWLLAAAMALFFAGCVMGALIDGGTTLVTAHYHATVGAVAISRMGVAYLSAGEAAFAQPSARAVRGQLLAYTVGLVLLSGGLALGSVEKAPRKTSAGELSTRGPWFKTGMSISGVGGLFAMVGAGWLVLNLLRKRDD